MKLNISNPTEAIYLNIVALTQSIELQLKATWVHYLSPFKLFNAEEQSSENGLHQKCRFKIPRETEATTGGVL